MLSFISFPERILARNMSRLFSYMVAEFDNGKVSRRTVAITFAFTSFTLFVILSNKAKLILEYTVRIVAHFVCCKQETP